MLAAEVVYASSAMRHEFGQQIGACPWSEGEDDHLRLDRKRGLMILVRPRAWWYNKVPLSFLMLLLLVDGSAFTFAVLWALAGLLGTVCCAANYGYALNELFDVDEDRRAGRANAAHQTDRRRMWTIIALSGTGAIGLATIAGGVPGFMLAGAELMLPLAYSVPPLRLKERQWVGALTDALAAHVFPAALAMAIVSRQSLHGPHSLQVAVVLLWSLATGLRGILSHLLQSEDSDRKAGLTTVVHRFGHSRVETVVVSWILPLEKLSFLAIIVQTHGTLFLKLIVVIFVIYEYLKFHFKVLPVVVFTHKGQRYIPFVDEGFYKVWGPLALALDASLVDVLYLSLVPLYVLSFRPRVEQERKQVCATAKVVFAHVDGFVARLIRG